VIVRAHLRDGTLGSYPIDCAISLRRRSGLRDPQSSGEWLVFKGGCFMAAALFTELLNVFRDLFVAGVVALSFSQARKSGEVNGRLHALKVGAISCTMIAGFAAPTMGNPSCSSGEDDPVRGGCAHYEDDGFDSALGQRTGRFLHVGLLLGVPAFAGLMSSRRSHPQPWRRPKASG